MALRKRADEIELMKISGSICAKALKKVLDCLKPGISAKELDTIATKEIKKNGGDTSFTTVEDYRWATCITFNEQVVHGIPTERKVKKGDIVSIDIGAVYKGYHSDMAKTVSIGTPRPDVRKFMITGEQALKKAIAEAKVGNNIGDISAAIQGTIEGQGYSVVKNLTGHGIGRELHEEPLVPGFGKRGTGQKILEGMTLAIEAIYARKSGEVFLEDDGWTISTKDGSLGGLFEQTILVSKREPIVLTPYL
jgi:methionyl aminopeptidase